MPPRNSRSDRHSRSTGRSSSRPTVRRTGSSPRSASRNEMGRYSRYSSESRSYPRDNRSAHRRTSADASSGAGQYSRSNSSYSHAATKKRGRGKKIAIAIVAVLAVALIGGGTAMALYIGGINDSLRGDLSDEELQAIDSQLSNTELHEPFYMLLMGSDIRDGQSQSESRSDTNILCRVDAENNQVTMLSILRDTAIDLDDYGIVKFNAAYSYEGPAGVIREASELCGVKIAHYAEVNFGNLEALVDAVGGVDIEVDVTINDPDADNSSWDPTSEPVILEPGMHHLNGREALVFARSRAFPDGDYTRTRHQRQLVEAIANKVLSLPVTELPGVVEAAAQCVTTDLTVTDIITLAQMFSENEGDMTLYSEVIPSTAEYVNGVSYVFADTDDLSAMMEIIKEGGDPSSLYGTDEDESTDTSSATDATSSGGYSSSYGSGSASSYDYG